MQFCCRGEMENRIVCNDCVFTLPWVLCQGGRGDEPMIREGLRFRPFRHVSPYRGVFDRACPRPRPFPRSLTSWYSVTLFQRVDHFTMRHNTSTTRGSNEKSKYVCCKTVRGRGLCNRLPINQLPPTIVWSSPRIPRAS